MPIIQHEVQKALRTAGLIKEVDSPKDQTIEEMLDNSGLTLQETVTHLADVVNGADTSNTKLRAIETSFKLRGTLKEQAAAPPSINIIINDSGLGGGSPKSVNGLNPILIPRRTQELVA